MKVVTHIVLALLFGEVFATTAFGQTAKKLGLGASPTPTAQLTESAVTGSPIGNKVGAIETKVAPVTKVGATMDDAAITPIAAPTGIANPQGVANGTLNVTPTNGGSAAYAPVDASITNVKSKTGTLNAAFAPQLFTQLPEARGIDGGRDVCLSPKAEQVVRARFIVVSGRFGGAYTEPATQEGKGLEHGLITKEFKPTYDGYESMYIARPSLTAKTGMEVFKVEWGWKYNVKTITQSNMVNGSVMGALNVSDKGAAVGGAGQSGITDTQQVYLFLGERCVANAFMYQVWENNLRLRNCVAAQEAAEHDPKKRKWASEICHERIAGPAQHAQAPAQGQQKQ